MDKQEILKKQMKILSYVINHGIVKGYELSNLVDVSERQILKYVKDLRNAGFDIQSKPGVNGGYYYNTMNCPICNSKIEIECKK